MGELFTLPVLLGIAYSGVRLATPYLYAAIGEMFAQRSGVLNLGVEGIMLMGAYTGFLVGLTTGNLWLGLLAAVAVGQYQQAADSLGVNVARVRYFTVMLGGALAGVAGASISMALVNLFHENM